MNKHKRRANQLTRRQKKMRREVQTFVILVVVAVTATVAQAQAKHGRGGWAKQQLSSAGVPSAPSADAGRINALNAKKSTIVGSWQVTVNIPGNPPPFDSFTAYWALTGDGIMLGAAQGDVTPAPFPSSTSQFGAWAQTGKDQFTNTFRSTLYDLSTGENLGSFKLRQLMTLSDSGDEWNGPFVLNVYDPDGNVLAEVTGTAHATRIKVEPLN